MQYLRLIRCIQPEIDSIDVQTGRIDKFGKFYVTACPGEKKRAHLHPLGEGAYSERVLIVYSGIRKYEHAHRHKSVY